MSGPSKLASGQWLETLGRIGRGVTLTIGWATKIVGLAGGVEQLVLHAEHPNSIALLVSGFLVAGGQGFESLMLRVFDEIVEDFRKGGKKSSPPA